MNVLGPSASTGLVKDVDGPALSVGGVCAQRKMADKTGLCLSVPESNCAVVEGVSVTQCGAIRRGEGDDADTRCGIGQLRDDQWLDGRIPHAYISQGCVDRVGTSVPTAANRSMNTVQPPAPRSGMLCRPLSGALDGGRAGRHTHM